MRSAHSSTTSSPRPCASSLAEPSASIPSIPGESSSRYLPRPMEAMVQPGEVRVKRALLSVSNKTGVVEFARGLAGLGVELVSTGGTAAALREGGLGGRAVGAVTRLPQIMGGRGKKTHPKLYRGAPAAAGRRGDQGRPGRGQPPVVGRGGG